MIQGKVVEGKKIGRKLGFPTANIFFDSDPQVGQGAYAAQATIGGRTFQGMAYVGGESGAGRLLEVNIFDFEQDIYGCEIGVELFEFIRPVVKFDSQDDLIAQLGRDRCKVLEYFEKLFKFY